MVDIEYANAYTEVLEILKYIPQEDYNKIPKSRIEMFTSNANQDYHFEYNPQLDLNEQNTSKLAKTIIAILFRDYWTTEEQKEKILAKEKYDMHKQEQELSEKYNYDNLFKNKQKNIIEEEKQAENVALVEYSKENIFTKIKNFFRNIFRKQETNCTIEKKT